MNKKGFTLVELIAVVAILGFLSILVTPAVINVRNSILDSNIRNKFLQINIAAGDWASDRIVNRLPSVLPENDPIIKCISNGESTESCVIKNSNQSSGCYLQTVASLINNGYLAADSLEEGDSTTESDDVPFYANPFGGSLNDYFVCIRYNTNDVNSRKIITYVIGEYDEECYRQGKTYVKVGSEWTCN